MENYRRCRGGESYWGGGRSRDREDQQGRGISVLSILANQVTCYTLPCDWSRKCRWGLLRVSRGQEALCGGVDVLCLPFINFFVACLLLVSRFFLLFVSVTLNVKRACLGKWGSGG